MDQVRRQFETNVFGLLRMCQLVLPGMRRQGWGKIVNISSMGGRLVFPGGGIYHGTKFAVEAISDAMRWEVRNFGVDVILIEPGGVKTPIWGKSTETADGIMEAAPSDVQELYGKLIDGVRARTQKIARETGSDPSAVAEAIGTALTADKPRTRYLVGSDAKLRARMAKVLPDRVMDRMILRALGD